MMKEPKPTNKMLTLTEVGRQLGVSCHTVRKLTDAGVLHAFQPAPGLPLRVWESELLKYRERARNK